VKTLRFVGSSLDDLRNFPAEARRQAGFELYAVQRGLQPSDSKPMNDIGAGVREIRVYVLGEWRVLYVAKFADAVYVLIPFRRSLAKRDVKTLSLRGNGTGSLEIGNEFNNHGIERQCNR
jgi:phage-related protein